MYDGKRMAVVFNVAGDARVVTGLVNSDVDPDLGPVVRIELEQNGDGSAVETTLILQQQALQGRLSVDNRYGCDWCLHLAHMRAHHEEGRAPRSP